MRYVILGKRNGGCNPCREFFCKALLRQAKGQFDRSRDAGCIGAAMGFGVSMALVKSLTRTESALSILFWMLVVQSVAGGLNAVGYSGIGYKTSGVRAVPLSAKEGSEVEEATEDNAVTGKYPLARVLYVYVNKAPNKPLAPMEAEFFKMVLSKTGQNVVVKDGYIPLPAAMVAKELAKLQ